MIMTKITDETIPTICAECEACTAGYTRMLCHIVMQHGDRYSMKEAEVYAQQWVEEAHKAREENDAAYFKDKALEDAIDRMIDVNIDARKD